jgi:putative phage-type endonuclease
VSAVLHPVALAARDYGDRSKYLGGSDAAAVMGLSPYATPVELWQEKTGRAPKEPEDPIRQKMLARGHRLEPFIREMAVDKLRSMGLTVELLATNARYNDPEFGFLSCEIDFELEITGIAMIGGAEVIFDGEHVNADAKSVTGFARKKWGYEDTEDVPIEYAAQFMHGLMVTGRRYCLVAALRSFDDVDIYWTVRDDETIAAMRPKLVEFWTEHVLKDVPPDPMRFDDIKALFPLDNGLAIEASDDIADKVVQLRQIKAQISQWEKDEEALKFEIAEFISPNARLTYCGADVATWKGQNDTRLDSTALKQAEPDVFAKYTRTKVVRVLRLPAPKKGKQ